MPVFLLPVLSFARRIPTWAWVALAAVIALWWYGNHREHQGVMAERARWEVVQAKAASEAAKLAVQRDEAVRRAEVADAERQRVYALKTAPLKIEVQSYAQSPAGAVKCVDPVGLRLGQASIDAANSATSAAR